MWENTMEKQPFFIMSGGLRIVENGNDDARLVVGKKRL